MEKSMRIMPTQLQRQRSFSSNDESLPLPKKIKTTSADPIMPNAPCCNIASQGSFLGIKVSSVASIVTPQKPIGEGNFASISLATCCAHKKSVAIKRFKQAIAYAWSLEAALESPEILTRLKSIDNPHIMKFYAEYLESNPDSTEEIMRRRYLAVEYIEGFDLQAAFEHISGMTQDTIYYLMDQFCNISSALEEYNIWHGQLDFSSTMYCIYTRTLKVVDFGTAKFFPSDNINDKLDQQVKLFWELGQTISFPFIDELRTKFYKESMSTDQLSVWIQSESEKFQKQVEHPIRPFPWKKEISPPASSCLELSHFRTRLQTQHLTRLSNETVIKIIAWSTIRYYIVGEKDPGESYFRHFTLEKIRDFQKHLPKSNDNNLRYLYACSLKNK